MNVVLPLIFVLEIAAAFTRTEAIPHWKWNERNKRFGHHPYETNCGCAVGHCVKAWECPKTNIVQESTDDNCLYWENGPWVCCLINEYPHHWEDVDIYSSQSPNGNPKTTTKIPKGNIVTSTEKYNYGKTNKPILNRNAGTLSTHNKPLGDVWKNVHEKYPSYRPTAAGTKVQNEYTTKVTKNDYNKFASRVTNSWEKHRTSESRIIFPTERVTKYTTSIPYTKRMFSNEPTKKAWTRYTSTKVPTEHSTADSRRTISTITKHPYSKKTTVSTKATTHRNQNRSKPTTAYHSRSQTVKPKTTSYISTRSTTRRYPVTTPLPNVNSYLCGIGNERTVTRRQARDQKYRHNPTTSSNVYSRSRVPYQRIVGGEEAEPFSWPWVAALYKVTSSGGNRFLSAGTLINQNFILTAAHVFTPDDLRTASYVVMLGTHDAQDAVAQYIVSSVLLHPKYEHRYYYNDIALLKLEKKVIFNDYIMPVCLPSPYAPLHSDKDLQGKNVTVMGWGDDSFGGKSSQVLKEATFPILSRITCNASYVRVASNRFPKGITAEMLCAGDPQGGKDACQGDSGGPLTVNENGRHTQVGIVSFGYKCGDKEYPGVYTKVAPYLNWIAENTKHTVNSLDYHY